MNKTVALITLALIAMVSAGACTKETSGTGNGPEYTSVGQIVAQLKAGGLDAEGVRASDAGLSGAIKSYDVVINHTYQSGFLIFATPADLAHWENLSHGMGGISVHGDTWAISLPSDGQERTGSIPLAKQVAGALGGTRDIGPEM